MDICRCLWMSISLFWACQDLEAKYCRHWQRLTQQKRPTYRKNICSMVVKESPDGWNLVDPPGEVCCIWNVLWEVRSREKSVLLDICVCTKFWCLDLYRVFEGFARFCKEKSWWTIQIWALFYFQTKPCHPCHPCSQTVVTVDPMNSPWHFWSTHLRYSTRHVRSTYPAAFAPGQGNKAVMA